MSKGSFSVNAPGAFIRHYTVLILTMNTGMDNDLTGMYGVHSNMDIDHNGMGSVHWYG